MVPKHSNKIFFELEVANFGPIEKGKVQLRPLTVFIGPSNTGKSYLAILVYALHKFFSDNRRGFPYPLLKLLREVRDTTLSESVIDELLELLQTIEKKKETNSELATITLPREISKLACKEYVKYGKDLGNQIQRCFGFDSGNALIRKFSGENTQVILRSQNIDMPNSFQHNLTISANRSKIETLVPEIHQLQIDVNQIEEMTEGTYFSNLEYEQSEEDRKFYYQHSLAEIMYIATRQLAGQFDSSAYYLPADRTGVMHAHSVVVSALIESAALTGLRPTKPTPMLSGVMADFLEQLISLENRQVRTNKRVSQSLSDGIEDSILDGKVSIRKSTGINYPRFTYKPKGWTGDLSLMNASSMVSELTPIVLYLRHVVSLGSTLIIEEPESHLHPAMQVELTRQIAKIVDSGVNVIVTTHSEWVLEELANIVRRSEIADNSQLKSGGEEIALSPDQVGAWLFRPNEKRDGSTITEIQLDDSGLYPSGFDEVAIELHNAWATIANEIDNPA